MLYRNQCSEKDGMIKVRNALLAQLVQELNQPSWLGFDILRCGLDPHLGQYFLCN
jgi:hypothetical protein